MMRPAESINNVMISVGSNIQPEKYITKALEIIRSQHDLIKKSHFVRTRPIGFLDQNDFMNGVILIQTSLNRKELTLWLKQVEDQLDRVRTENKNGPRTIDLDIIAWNGKLTDNDVYDRDFLRNAIFEIEPQFFKS